LEPSAANLKKSKSWVVLCVHSLPRRRRFDRQIIGTPWRRGPGGIDPRDLRKQAAARRVIACKIAVPEWTIRGDGETVLRATE
jgi:hypothetical protein